MSEEVGSVEGGESIGEVSSDVVGTPEQVDSTEAVEITGDASEVHADGEEAAAVEEDSGSPEGEKLYEVKVDGESIKVSLEEMMKGFQLGSSAHKKFQEAAQVQKQARQLEEMLKSNPIEAARQAGITEQSLREYAEKYLYELIQLDEMSPEEKEFHDLKKYKEQQEGVETKRQEEASAAKQAQETEFYQNQLIDSYDKALSSAGVHKSEAAISRIASIQLDAVQSGWEMPVEMAVDQFVKEQRSLVDNYLQNIDEDQIESVLGKEKMKALRKKEIAKLKNPTSTRTTEMDQRAPQENKHMSASDFFNSLK